MSFWRKLRGLFPSHRAAQERDLQEELESLKAMAGKNELGNLTLVAEGARDVWRWSWLETLWQDIRYSLRTLRRSPGFTITAVLILSIGIGLNLTFFQLVNGVYLKPLPVRDAGSLVNVSVPAGLDGLNYAAMELIRSNNNVFSAVLMDMRMTAREHQLEWGDDPTPLTTYYVSPNWFDELGVKALHGRLFSESTDGGPGARPVAVISERYWEMQLQRKPDVIGSTIRLSKTGGPVSIIGVVPRTQGILIGNTQIWVPVEQLPYLFPEVNLRTRVAVWGRMYGRLRPGVSPGAAAEGLQPVLEELTRQQPSYLRNNTVALYSGSTNFRSPTRVSPWRILAVGGSFTLLVLLITCANLANLVLSRAMSRVQELSVRVSLGASRVRVMRHLLTETALLSILASGGGLLMAYAGTRFAATFNGGDLLWRDLSVDWRILTVATGGTLLMTALVGVQPAWTIGKRDLAMAMKDGGEQTSYSLSRVRHRKYLLATQVAGSCLLLVVAGLVLRTWQQVLAPPGFDYENVLVAERIGLEKDKAQAYWTSLRHNIAQLPGIEGVALSRERPLGNIPFVSVPTLPGIRFNLSRVEPNFFHVLRIPFLTGKPFASSAVEGQAIVLSKSLALQVFGTVDVVGRSFPGNGTITGIVEDVRLTQPEDADRLEAYAPLRSFDRVVLLARTRTGADVAGFIQALPDALRPLDSRIPTLYPLKREVDFLLEGKQRMSVLLSTLAALALSVSCIGIFGLVSYSATLRRKEIGIRLALGALHRSIVFLMVRQLVWPVSLAIVAGLIGGVALGKVFASDGQFSAPTVSAVAVAIFVLVAAVGLACVLPTLRALRSSDTRVLS